MRALLLACLLAAVPCQADEDEAWLHRADVPAGTRPLLAVLLDPSTATGDLIDAPPPYDPQFDYGAGLAAAVRCEAAATFARRGPGPAPDCRHAPVLDGLACEAARAPLAAYGYFVAAPAIATECLATGRQVDSHVFYSGNFLNYLQAQATIEQRLATVLADRLADALAATAGLDVARVQSLVAAGQWLRGESGASPFESACRPVSLAVLAARDAAEDEQVLATELGTTDLSDDLPGTQSAPVTWLAPGLALSPSDPLAWPNLVAAALQHDAAVPAGPQLSAAGLLPSDADSIGPGVILGLVAPRAHARWPGNLFRYGLRAPASPLEPPLVVDRDRDPAIDPASGLPYPIRRSYWSDTPDANLLSGGAAGRLPSPDARRILSDGDAPAPEELDFEPTLGDPGLHAPVVVADEESGRTLVLSATQDGLLHAFDAQSGVEQWAWIPQALLPRLPELASDLPAISRSHGIDGALVLHERESGDGHRWLLFGLGRGGARYYALDLAAPDDPRLIWSFALPDDAVQARGEPVVTRLAIAGSGQSAGNWVVLLPGGYDPRFDAPDAAGTGAGDVLQIVDAATGRPLWDLGGFTTLPSAPRALDLDGDGNLDRAYVVDVTGNLWRIDFTSGAAVATLATARRIARLGTGAHRFFATPDVSVVRTGELSRLAIAVGSGALTRPRDTSLADRVYVLYDALTGAAPPEATESDLHDATIATDALPPDARGWFVRLEAHGTGEKVIGPTVTFDHALRFQTYQPLPPDAAAPCGPPRAVVRRYALDLRTALPRNTAAEAAEDEPEEIAVSGLPPTLRFGLDAHWQEGCDGCRPHAFGIAGGATFDTGYAGDPVRTSWRKLAPPPASP
jgi:hypothetical protein